VLILIATTIIAFVGERRDVLVHNPAPRCVEYSIHEFLFKGFWLIAVDDEFEINAGHWFCSFETSLNVVNIELDCLIDIFIVEECCLTHTRYLPSGVFCCQVDDLFDMLCSESVLLDVKACESSLGFVDLPEERRSFAIVLIN